MPLDLLCNCRFESSGEPSSFSTDVNPYEELDKGSAARLLKDHVRYYREDRTHHGLGKDADHHEFKLALHKKEKLLESVVSRLRVMRPALEPMPELRR